MPPRRINSAAILGSDVRMVLTKKVLSIHWKNAKADPISVSCTYPMSRKNNTEERSYNGFIRSKCRNYRGFDRTSTPRGSKGSLVNSFPQTTLEKSGFSQERPAFFFSLVQFDKIRSSDDRGKAQDGFDLSRHLPAQESGGQDHLCR